MSNSCDPMDCSLPGSCVHGILQARILEWIAVACPGPLPDPGVDPVCPPWHVGQVFLLLRHQDSPMNRISALIKETPEDSLTSSPREGPVRRGHL